MAAPTRETAITPFQKHLQDTMLADSVPLVGMTTLVADRVYVLAPPKTVGALGVVKPYVLISSPTELGRQYAFGRISNENTQQIDIFDKEGASSSGLLAIFSRVLYLFDRKKPSFEAHVALLPTRVEFIGAYPDNDGGSHAIAMVNPTLRCL